MLAGMLRIVEATLFRDYFMARLEHDELRARWFADRFRPELRAAVEAWEALDEPAKLGTNPLQRPEYVLRQDRKAQELRVTELAFRTEAHDANKTSDRYVMLTVLAAAALFLGGLAASFESAYVRIATLALSGFIVAALAVILFSMPVAPG